MPISKKKALALIDEKIKQYENILQIPSEYLTEFDVYFKTDTFTRFVNEHVNEYRHLKYTTEVLLKELFSDEEAEKFCREVYTYVGDKPLCPLLECEGNLNDYRNHINNCILKLNVYKEQIQNYWGEPQIINWEVFIGKVQPLWNPIKRSWAFIFAILVFLGVIADAANGFTVISGIIYNLSNYTKLI